MADVLDSIVAAAHGTSYLTGISGTVGRLELERLGEYPRIVWVSEGGRIDAPDNIGGRYVAGAGGAADDRYRQVRTDEMAVSLYIWGEDREAARSLMHAAIVAVWSLNYGSLDFGRYRYETETVQRGEHATHGSLIRLEMTIRTPVREDAATLTDVTHQGHETTFQDHSAPQVICT